MVNIYLYLAFNDNTEADTYLSMKSMKKEFDSIKKIKIFVYFIRGLYSLPFKLTIIRKRDKSKLYLYLAISCIILACLLCGLIIYFLSRKISENARVRQRALIQLAMRSQRGEYNTRDGQALSGSENFEEENRKKIEILLKTILAPQNFIKQHREKYGNTCTICIENFKGNISKVSITPCNHIFHYKCLSNWLIKNVINPKCPNCNYNLVNIKIDEIQTINVARKTDVEENIISQNIQENNGNLNTNDNLVCTRNISNRNMSRLGHSQYNVFLVDTNVNTNEIQEVDIHNI
jgi:hypothetical protein